MRTPPAELRAHVKALGWKHTDLAARWGLSLQWVSRMISRPDERTDFFEDAFRGLPPRADVTVVREPRHDRKLSVEEKESRRRQRAVERAKRAERERLWSKAEMFPSRRVFEAIDNRIVEEGSRLQCLGLLPQGLDEPRVRFLVLTGDASGQELDVKASAAATHLQDIGLDHAA